MAAKKRSVLLVLTLLAAIQHLAQSRRGDEQTNETEDGSAFTRLQMLPEGHLRSEAPQRRQIDSHTFPKNSPMSLLQQAAFGKDHSTIPQSDAGNVEKITIELPFERWLEGPPQPTVEKSGSSSSTQVALPQFASTKMSSQGPQPKPEESNRTAAWVGKDFSGLFKNVSYTTIRISTIASQVNWFEPYQRPQDVEFTGSGFAVALDDVPDAQEDPVFITNAHVVRNAHDVRIQLPGIGQKFFEAYVPLICDEFDLAVIQLVEPAKFLKELVLTENKKLVTLPIVDYPLMLGLEVASLGFPLGSTSMKLSRGVISGTEEVGDFIRYQTTAPISPGSSGGPLFALDTKGELRVVGATFASSGLSEAQNTNYVVPAIAIMQVLEQYKQKREQFQHPPSSQAAEQKKAKIVQAGPYGPHAGTGHRASMSAMVQTNVAGDSSPALEANQQNVATSHSAKPSQGEPDSRTLNQLEVSSVGAKVAPHHPAQHQKKQPTRIPHFQLKIAPIDAVGIEGNDALYQTYGCQTGVFISKILSTSVFNHADVPLKEKTFLTAIDGVPIDQFGMGRTAAFLHDPIPFESLMMLKVRPGDKVTLTTCGAGPPSEKEVKHTMSMQWTNDLYKVGITNVVEPYFDQSSASFEFFAGITIMELTVNHILRLLKIGRSPTLGRWLLPENQVQKRLLITHVERDADASRVLEAGMVISKINGHGVGTLEQLRDMKVFMPASGATSWTLETDRGTIFATKFEKTLLEQISTAEQGMAFMNSESVMNAAKQLAGNSNKSSSESKSVTGRGSLAQTASTDSTVMPHMNTRLEKVQALLQAAIDVDTARRKARVAQAGFTLAASEDTQGEELEPE